ncbi:hypothetical protein Q7P37_000828 [Cladosporium fusiforme]
MAKEQSPSLLLSCDFSKSFDVLVGKPPAQQQFSVYTDVLTKRSGFFRAARSSQWLSDTKKPADLEDEDPEVFSIYLKLVYAGATSLHLLNANAIDGLENMENVKAGYSILIDLYLLADKLQDSKAANEIIDEIIRISDISKFCPCASVVNKAYEFTGENNPLRRLMRDFYLIKVDGKRLHQSTKAYVTPELHKDMVLEYWQSGGTVERGISLSSRKEHYHQPDD